MEVIQQTGAVVAVLALLLLTLWWLRKRGLTSVTLGRKTAARRLESLERLPLGPQHALHLVRMGGSALLISSSSAGCALIHRAPWQEIDGSKAAE
ncbi:MAG: flagellar biosynthetic protein FliO [Bryobacteraceae bacterium]|jgi:flagellar biosynthetic protein FliO